MQMNALSWHSRSVWETLKFTGRINIKDYLGAWIMTILTSVSEGQPLTILESYAAHKPVIATDVETAMV